MSLWLKTQQKQHLIAITPRYLTITAFRDPVFMVSEFLQRFSKFLTIKDNGSEEPL